MQVDTAVGDDVLNFHGLLPARSTVMFVAVAVRAAGPVLQLAFLVSLTVVQLEFEQGLQK